MTETSGIASLIMPETLFAVCVTLPLVSPNLYPNIRTVLFHSDVVDAQAALSSAVDGCTIALNAGVRWRRSRGGKTFPLRSFTIVFNTRQPSRKARRLLSP